jgi:putative component of membrane protein insertase Oxa1/YidC/SpoIIIJ protein YidD
MRTLRAAPVLLAGAVLFARPAPGAETVAPERAARAAAVGHAVLDLYRTQIRPAIGQRCSLHPSCSEYARQALSRHGLLGIALIGDRAVREPDLVAAQADPIVINGRRFYRDPLDAHDGWLTAARGDASVEDGRPAAPPRVALPPARALSEDLSLALALDLMRETRYTAAALEFRRLALAAPMPETAAGYAWAAAYAELRAGDHAAVDALLDRVEPRAPALRGAALALRGQAALDAGRTAQAAFYLDSLAHHAPPASPQCRFALRRLARVHVLQNDLAAAEDTLRAPGLDDSAAVDALAQYRGGPARRPRLGGVLGLLPGLGYAYSGEYANAARSLILNGLFLWGMAETAQAEHWGGFAALTFFELTWYTGSIYGGIDAAHRFNTARREACLSAIDGAARLQPELDRLPLLSVRYEL